MAVENKMFDGVFFFMYIFAGFAGFLAILLAVLLIRHWSSGNKALLASIRNFMICTALIDFLYFYFDYYELVTNSYHTHAIVRVADICLFIGQVYFWNVYLREKSMVQNSERIALQKMSAVVTGICIVLAVTGYGFLMDDYYIAKPGFATIAMLLIEVFIAIMLTYLNFRHLAKALAEMIQKKCRVYICSISVLLAVNGVWNGILVIYMLFHDINTALERWFDPTSVFLFAINLLTIFLIFCEDFTALFKTAESQNPSKDRLAQRLDYVAETHSLTEREREVLELAYEGLTNPEIAEKLFVSKYTIKRHMHNIFGKLDVSTRMELVHLINGEKNVS